MSLHKEIQNIKFQRDQFLNSFSKNKLSKNEIVNASTLYNYGLVDSPTTNYKILGTGSLSKPLKIVANRFSASAKKIIEQAGGTFEETDPYEKKIRNRKHLRKNQVSKEKIAENQEDEKNDEQE